MTGFASTTREDATASVGVTIRAVNHRYLDLQLRVPPALAALENRIRGIVQREVARGRLEVSLALQLREPRPPEVELNEPFVRRLAEAMARGRDQRLVDGPLTPGDLLRFPQALVIREAPADESAAGEVPALVEAAIEEALGALNQMRAREGAHLHDDLEARRALLGELLERAATAADAGRGMLEQRLAERVSELSRELPADPAAIAQEIVRTAARSDISEEVVRFRGHLAHWAALTEGGEPCGRKLDFLLQEMNREINTIGSKADGEGVPELVVAIKAELEKMREQVQNVE